jgi:hypothetical protein
MATAAKACMQALRDATGRWSSRSRASDGILGDSRHKARKSDHNDGNAFDLTNDPKNGVDCEKLSRLAINDTRVKYVIWNRQIYICSSKSAGWQAYSGANPHDKHMHVSISTTARDDTTPWVWSPGQPDPYGESSGKGKIQFFDIKNLC